MTKIGAMICGHGSRSQAAADEFAVLAEKLPTLLSSYWPIEYGYLDFAKSVIRDGLDRLRAKGCTKILAVPGIFSRPCIPKTTSPRLGFVGAAESKAELANDARGAEFVALRGRKGGSAMASAGVNALAKGLPKGEI